MEDPVPVGFSMSLDRFIVVLCLLLLNTETHAQNQQMPRTEAETTDVKLGELNVFPESITLSGFSSGGVFAQQLQLAYSSLFSGIALFSDSYYRCGPGDGSTVSYYNSCSTLGNLTRDQYWNVDMAILDLESYAQQGLIEDPDNLKNKRLYVFVGTQNRLLDTSQMLDVLTIYEPYIQNPRAIRTHVMSANLTLPSHNFGAPCASNPQPTFFVSNCDYNGAFEALHFLLGKSVSIIPNYEFVMLQPLRTFNQSEFFGAIETRHEMDTSGFIYIPTQCQRNQTPCLLHFYFHGCSVGREFVGDQHIRNSGFLEVAELNNIVAIFPQVLRNEENNPFGCWDVFGYTGPLYATQRGTQVTVVHNMLATIFGMVTPTESSLTLTDSTVTPIESTVTLIEPVPTTTKSKPTSTTSTPTTSKSTPTTTTSTPTTSKSTPTIDIENLLSPETAARLFGNNSSILSSVESTTTLSATEVTTLQVYPSTELPPEALEPELMTMSSTESTFSILDLLTPESLLKLLQNTSSLLPPSMVNLNLVAPSTTTTESPIASIPVMSMNSHLAAPLKPIPSRSRTDELISKLDIGNVSIGNFLLPDAIKMLGNPPVINVNVIVSTERPPQTTTTEPTKPAQVFMPEPIISQVSTSVPSLSKSNTNTKAVAVPQTQNPDMFTMLLDSVTAFLSPGNNSISNSPASTDKPMPQKDSKSISAMKLRHEKASATNWPFLDFLMSAPPQELKGSGEMHSNYVDYNPVMTNTHSWRGGTHYNNPWPWNGNYYTWRRA